MVSVIKFKALSRFNSNVWYQLSEHVAKMAIYCRKHRVTIQTNGDKRQLNCCRTTHLLKVQLIIAMQVRSRDSDFSLVTAGEIVCNTKNVKVVKCFLQFSISYLSLVFVSALWGTNVHVA